MNNLKPGQIEHMKRQAKAMRRAGTHTHVEALNEIAQERGYADWRQLVTENPEALKNGNDN